MGPFQPLGMANHTWWYNRCPLKPADSPGHAGDEAAEELLCQRLGQAAARLGRLVDDHGAVEHVGAVSAHGERQTQTHTHTHRLTLGPRTNKKTTPTQDRADDDDDDDDADADDEFNVNNIGQFGHL